MTFSVALEHDWTVRACQDADASVLSRIQRGDVTLNDDTGGRACGSRTVVGEQITRAREDVGMSQAQLGDELGRLLGKPWPRQAVSQAEKGRRSFNAAELVAFAAALGRSVESLLVPPANVPTVTPRRR